MDQDAQHGVVQQRLDQGRVCTYGLESGYVWLSCSCHLNGGLLARERGGRSEQGEGRSLTFSTSPYLSLHISLTGGSVRSYTVVLVLG